MECCMLQHSTKNTCEGVKEMAVKLGEIIKGKGPLADYLKGTKTTKIKR
jgi:hypothetical protein